MPKTVDHQQRRAEISEIAAKLIASGGLEAATIREIARQSGYSKGIIEHFFDRKEDLISAALDWANLRYNRRAALATESLSGLAAVRARIQATLPLDEETREEWRIRLIFWSMASIDPALQDRQAQRFIAARRRFETDLRQARQLGELKAGLSIGPAAERLLYHISGVSCAALHNTSRYQPHRLRGEASFLIQSLSA